MQYILLFRVLAFSTLLLIAMSSCSSNRSYSKSSTKKTRTTKVTSRSTASKAKINTSTRSTRRNEETNIRSKIVDTAMKYQGIEYVYGGKTPRGFDCSGFTSYVFNELGLDVVKGASFHQATQGKRTTITQAKPGDLIFFESKGRVVHVSIVVDHSEDELWVVHSTSSRGVVKDEILSSTYWKPRISSVRDVIN